MSLPEGYTFRKVEQSDFSNNYVQVLKVLTTVGDIIESGFQDLVQHWQSLPEIYYPRVITNESGTIVATGMLFVERKLIHSFGKVGHIEDIAVASSEQGKKLGLAIITRLSQMAQEAGCYKVILDCSTDNVGFYEKCGYKDAGIEMAKRFD